MMVSSQPDATASNRKSLGHQTAGLGLVMIPVMHLEIGSCENTHMQVLRKILRGGREHQGSPSRRTHRCRGKPGHPTLNAI